MDIKLSWSNYYQKDYVLGYPSYGTHILAEFSLPPASTKTQPLTLFAAGYVN